MSTDVPISVCEIVKHFLEENLDVEVFPGGVYVGPAGDDDQQLGCISLVEAGQSERELYLPIISARIQVRCVARTLEHVERMGRTCYLLLNDVNREVGHQPSTNQNFLIHLMSVVAGPSTHFDSPETWENLLFVAVMIGTQPIP